jgi:hypothetical protein
MALTDQLQSDLAAGDVEGANATFARIQENTARARTAGTDPLWRAAGSLPFFGPNFSAISEVTVSADDVVNRAVAPLLQQMGPMDWDILAPVDGRIDVAPVKDLSPRLSTAANTVRLSYERLSSIDAARLLPEVAVPLEEATSRLHEAGEALNDAAAAAEVVPGMLGADEPRKYLLLIQNSAEVRATGGIPGALAEVTATNGRIELTAQDSASAMGRFDPAIIVDPAQTPIFSTRMGRFMQSSNLTPDFPTAAQTAATMWETRHEGSTINGVIAIDPVALSHILQATGPVELSFDNASVGDLLIQSGLPTSLTADNVLQTLLSDVYAAIEEPRLQDEYFAAVAAVVFDALSSGTGNNKELIHALTRSTNEGRIYVWSADNDEQSVIASTDLAGSVTGSESSGGAAFGAFFNDGTGAKMDYYVRRTVQLSKGCTAEGYHQYTLIVTLKNIAPADAAESLPTYVTGGGVFGVPVGTVQTNFVGYGPDQSQLQTARINGEPVPLGSYRHGDRPVGVLTTTLEPGQTATVELDFTNVVQQSEPKLDVTPTIQPTKEVVLPLQVDGTCG